MKMIDAHDPAAMGQALLQLVASEEQARGTTISRIMIDEHGLRFVIPVEDTESR